MFIRSETEEKKGRVVKFSVESSFDELEGVDICSCEAVILDKELKSFDFRASRGQQVVASCQLSDSSVLSVLSQVLGILVSVLIQEGIIVRGSGGEESL